MDSAGVRILTNDGPGEWGEGEEWVFSVRFEVTPLVEPDGIPLGVNLVVAAVGEEVFVLDPQNARVVVLDEGGKVVRVFGRLGSGPGEFAEGVANIIGVGERLYIPDLGNGRIHIFDRLGTLQEETEFPSDQGAVIAFGSMDGDLLAQFRRVRSKVPDRIVAFDRSNAPGRTLAEVPMGTSMTVSAEGQPRITLLAPEPQWLGSGRGLYVALGEHYELQLRNTEGALRGIMRRAEPSVPVPTETVERLRETVREGLTRRGSPLAVVETIMQGVSVAETVPAVFGLLAGPDGTILVQRPELPLRFRHEPQAVSMLAVISSTWDVLDADGVFMGTLEFPEGFMPHVWSNGLLVGVRTDELGIETILALQRGS